MDAGRTGTDARDGRFDELYAEAKATLGYGGNSLRSITDRYREAYRDALAQWHRLRDELDADDRQGPAPAEATSGAAAAEAGAEDARRRALRGDVERMTGELGRHQGELSKLELSVRSMESTWLFLERGDASLLSDRGGPWLPTDIQMRIVEAQEAERSRLAQEVHDGPAQALSNAIFQVEYIERMLEPDPRLAATELRFLRELLRRELGDVRTFISQLRPPLLDELGLDGTILDTVENMAALTGTTIETDLRAPGDRLSDGEQTAVLRIVQEALQNVRKHAAASRTVVATRLLDAEWVVEISDDGHGFEVGEVAARGRRNFGLQFMRERAELIGARFEVRSRPAGGHHRLARDPHRTGGFMSAMEYQGPERRRGGPDRRGPDEKTRILLVDDHALFRVGMRNILEKEADFFIVGDADDTRSAFDAAVEHSPDIVLMDLSLPAPGGIEATQRIKRELPSAGIIVLAVSEDEDALFDAIKAGAAAFILKDVGPDDLVTIIRRVAAGEYLINDKVFAKPSVASRVLKEFRELAIYGQEAAPIFAPLSPREVEILDNIAQGMTNKQVAYALSISEQTVKNHMSSILRKLSVNDRTQAVVYAMRQGWIRMPEE